MVSLNELRQVSFINYRRTLNNLLLDMMLVEVDERKIIGKKLDIQAKIVNLMNWGTKYALRIRLPKKHRCTSQNEIKRTTPSLCLLKMLNQNQERKNPFLRTLRPSYFMIIAAIIVGVFSAPKLILVRNSAIFKLTD